MQARRLTGTGAVVDKPTNLRGLTLKAGSDAATVILHDNPSAGSGTVLAELAAVANTTAVLMFPDDPLRADAGIYATTTGTNEILIVYTV